jgi:putative oxidoreductase
MWDQLRSLGLVLGRFLLSTIFLLSGVMKLMHWRETAAQMESEGMVAVPFFLCMAAATEIIGGLLVLVGYKASWSAVVLAAFLVPVTLTMHHFWTYEGEAMANQMQHFLKNLAIIGGLLTLAASGAGRFAIDNAGSVVERRRELHESAAAPVR